MSTTCSFSDVLTINRERNYGIKGTYYTSQLLELLFRDIAPWCLRSKVKQTGSLIIVRPLNVVPISTRKTIACRLFLTPIATGVVIGLFRSKERRINGKSFSFAEQRREVKMISAQKGGFVNKCKRRALIKTYKDDMVAELNSEWYALDQSIWV